MDHEGEILESYITRTRDKDAALRFMKKALKRHGSPEATTTDVLRSYRAAIICSVKHLPMFSLRL
ncbi:DDE-type integrase/transposase/recombinase [Sphingomonas endolithica]|uniref:DDE-type integrase/transposase/recombinase n=1 Tax=Sphingomonas endolithica TaxID=2972485 RepID=UPI0021AF8471|nr:DDE-type integrase/transposase/recombinase [Sphingomonas sp. ZFBP2030]